MKTQAKEQNIPDAAPAERVRVAITQGDTNGIGWEVILKTFSEPAMLEICTPIIYGHAKVADFHA